MKKLRTISAAAACLLAAAACVKENTGLSKLEAMHDSYTLSSRGSSVPGQDTMERDTVVYMTAVAFPEDYDWQRDTSFGGVAARIVLYRDGEVVAEVPAGPGCIASPDHDLHHLVGGRLYTEHCTSESTVIGRDGEVLFSYPGREFLCGLLVEGSDVYTLGQGRAGSGLSLRCNGRELFSSASGTPAAHIHDRPDYPSGALYRDRGRLCFSYWEPSADGSRTWYIVEDGTAMPVSVPDTRTMYDIRLVQGEPDIRPVTPSRSRNYVYEDGQWRAGVSFDQGGKMAVSAPVWPSPHYFSKGYLFPSFRCACLHGSSFYIGMNPTGARKGPFLWKDGAEAFRPGINGFITAVDVVEEQVPPAGKAEDS